ncbi:hypothetical protein EYF80_000206 [Liparis tanakae]|uniref:Uncharacterized protein n=1 Tax=Liparis tanakae TaxID=230148 RepID=A0A4Z2JIG6_9TELE|nr:hypothetical protein EYF80_000206 [Liparis tanakae]
MNAWDATPQRPHAADPHSQTDFRLKSTDMWQPPNSSRYNSFPPKKVSDTFPMASGFGLTTDQQDFGFDKQKTSAYPTRPLRAASVCTHMSRVPCAARGRMPMVDCTIPVVSTREAVIRARSQEP